MILASASPRRRELLGECGLALTVCPADVDETRLAGEGPTKLVGRLAQEKAHAVQGLLEELGERSLVAADTIVWDEEGDVLGKPADAAEARAMLRALSGRTHHVSTGACVVLRDASGGLHERSFVETTDVTFRTLSEEEIEAYVASGEPMDKAGAYGIQGLGRLLVEGIRGDYPNVVGLPVNRTLRELDALLAQAGEAGIVTEILGGQHGEAL